MSMDTRPTAGPGRPWEFPAVHHATLANGLRVSVAPMHRLPMVTVLALGWELMSRLVWRLRLVLERPAALLCSILGFYLILYR